MPLLAHFWSIIICNVIKILTNEINVIISNTAGDLRHRFIRPAELSSACQRGGRSRRLRLRPPKISDFLLFRDFLKH